MENHGVWPRHHRCNRGHLSVGSCLWGMRLFLARGGCALVQNNRRWKRKEA